MEVFYEDHSSLIAEIMLDKYKVDYNYRGNLIYIDEKFEWYFYKDSIVADLNKIFLLYLRYYNMEKVDCSKKKLTSLPVLPKLKILNCDDNRLISLPDLSPGLQELYCSYNALTSLPEVLSQRLRILECCGNQLKSL